MEVPVVRWPDAAATRERHARAGTPCLLVVGATDRAPTRWAELEDWVRETAPHAKFVTRAVTVARRADLLQRPRLDHTRVVRFHDRTVVVPETQARLVGLLVERFGETVADAEIRALCDGQRRQHPQRGGEDRAAPARRTRWRRSDCTSPRVRAAGYLLDRAN